MKAMSTQHERDYAFYSANRRIKKFLMETEDTLIDSVRRDRWTGESSHRTILPAEGYDADAANGEQGPDAAEGPQRVPDPIAMALQGLVVQFTYFLRQSVEGSSSHQRSKTSLSVIHTDVLDGIKSKFMQSVHEEQLNKETAGHSMTLMLYNYLKLEACRTRVDIKEQKETHGELLNLIAT